MLPSLVIKIEYRRALHRDLTGILRQLTIPSLPAAKNLSISSFPPAFLPGSAQYVENDVTHSKQTLEKNLPGATTPQMFYPLPEKSTPPNFSLKSTSLNYSFLAASPARAFGCGLSEESTTTTHSIRAVSPAQAFMFFGPLENSTPLPHTFRVNPEELHPERTREGRNAPFLTGSAPQTECGVTYSKQTTAPFLTGARTHISRSEFCSPFTPTLKQPPHLRHQLSRVISTH